MQLMTSLTRRQGWLSAGEISEGLRGKGNRATARTVRRWFSFLREAGGFVYYPYPKANLLGLQDVLVWAREVKDPRIFGLLPFGASFNVEVDLATPGRVVSQGYWIPAEAMKAFRAFWRTAEDLGLASKVEIFPARNTHYFYSPFEDIVRPDGFAVFDHPADNRHFADLARRNLRGPFEVKLGERYASSPLIIPIVVEHIWEHISSRQVWEAIREKGEASIQRYAHGRLARKFDRPGVGLHLLQQEWSALLEDFDTHFLQPRVFFNWPLLRGAQFVSIVLRAGGTERMIEAALAVSRFSLSTALKPGVEPEERCHLLCFVPSDQILSIVRVAREFHKGPGTPMISLQDREATLDLFESHFCRVDWRQFDPETLRWNFPVAQALKALRSLAA